MFPIAFALLAGSHVGGTLVLFAALAAAGAFFGTVNTVQTQGPLVGINSPEADQPGGQGINLPWQFEVLTGTTDVITGGGGSLQNVPGSAAVSTVPICGTSFIESSVVDATTLATPVAGAPSAGGNDGLTITIIDNSGHAHTVTTAANKITGNKHLVTFNGTAGSFVELMARNGIWIPLAQSGVTIS